MSVNLFWQPGMTLDSIEKMAIQQAYSFYRGVKAQTARALDISVRTLEAKMEKYEQDDSSQVARDRKDKYERENNQRRARGLPTLDQMPAEFEDEKRTREMQEENLKRANQLRREQGLRGVDPNSIASDLLRNNPPQEPAKAMQNSNSGSHVQPSSAASEEYAVSVSVGEEVQKVLSGKSAGTGKRQGR